MNKITKRLLAILLAIAMTVPNMQMSVFAEVLNNSDQTATEETAEEPEAEALAEEVIPLAEGTKPAEGTTKGQPFAKGTGESTYFRIPAMVTLSDGTIVAATDARWNQTVDNGGLDTIVSRSSDNGATWKYAYANYLGDNGNVYNNKSTAFIDPVLAVDKNDTIYMLVDLFPGGRALSNAADGQPETEKAFDANGRLLLKKSGDSSYNYYLKDGKIVDNNDNVVSDYTVDTKFNLVQNGKIVGNIFYRAAAYQVVPTTYLYLTKSTDKGSTWSEPALLNVKNEGEAFYGVGPGRGLVTSTGRIIFPCYTHPNEHTSFIYSDDNGRTWERTDAFADYSSETTLVEADGKLFAFFRCGGADYADIPYYVSTDNGSTWTRGPKNSQIDPCTSCQMNAITYSKEIDGQTAILLSCPTGSSRNNGKIFVGLVNDDNTLNWKYESNVISSSYSYSCLTELADGRVAVLAETGNGVETFKTLEMSDIAAGAEIGTSADEVVDETTGITVKADGLTRMTVTAVTVDSMTSAYVAYDITPYVGDTKYTGKAEVSMLLTDELKAESKLTGFVMETDGTITKIAGKKTENVYTFTVPHFSTVGVMALADEGSTGKTESAEISVGEVKKYEVSGLVGTEGDFTSPDGYVAYTIRHESQSTPGETKVEKVTNLTTGTYLIGDGTNWLTLDGANLGNTTDVANATEWTITNSENGCTIENDSNYLITSDSWISHMLTTSTDSKEWSWSSGQGFSYIYGSRNTRYYLRYNSGWTVGTSSSNVGTPYTKTTTSGTTTEKTYISFTGKAAGTSSIVIGDTTYNITVKSDAKVVDITIPVGHSNTFNVNAGEITSNTNPGVADISIEKLSGNYVKADQLESGKQYLLVNRDFSVLTSNTVYDSGKSVNGLECATGFATNIDYSQYLWTITEVSGGVTIVNSEGQYLDISSKSSAGWETNVTLSETPVTLKKTQAGEFFGFAKYINPYDMYLDRFSETFAAAFPGGGTGENEKWNLYAPASGYKMTITGTTVGKTTVVVGDTTYNITVREQTPEDLIGSGIVAKTGQGNGKVITKLTTSVGMSFDTDLKDSLGNGQTVEWTSDNSSVASVDQNGTITGVAVGNGTIITATVKDADGNIVAVNTIIVDVLAGNGSDGTKADKVLDFYIDKIEDTRVYYSLNCTSDLVEVKEHEAIYLSFDEDSNVAMNFFGDPDDGYALTFMNAPGSAGEYESLQDKTDPKNTDFYKLGAARNQKGPFGDQTVCDMIQKAMDMGSDGAQGFTRAASDKNDCKFTLSFRSEKLPEITKEVVAIRHVDGKSDKYYEGMTAIVGDEVFFKVAVHKEAYKDRIDYTNIKFIDEVAGMVLYNEDGSYYDKNNQNNRTVDFGTDFSTIEEVTKTYYVGYKVDEKDLDSTILNTAKLTHTYSSQYSKGSFEGSANADAKISATSFNPKDIVVDFGLPVAINFKDLEGNNKDLVEGEATANYGTVTVNDNLHSVTYTPATVLTEKDTVTLKVKNNKSGNTFDVTFDVYPATSVYYEEGFASYTGSWTDATKGTGTQAMHEVGKSPLYGYDDAYKDANGNSGNSVSVSSTVGDSAEFTFNGTGADIYALTKNNSGSMSMWLYDEDNNLLKLGFVDTSNTWLADAEDQDGNYYNTPVFSYKGLTEGTYKVVMKVQSGTISLDGFRVYNTQGDLYNDVYSKDKEENAQTVEVRDVTIAGSTYKLEEIDDWYKYGDNIIKAVYDATNNGSGAIILEEGRGITANANMINNGPKNEIYLKSGQAIAMKINGEAAKVAIGMRSLNGDNISYEINDQAEETMTSTVDMYYDVKTQLNDGVLVIQNTGSNVIALTKLKATQFKGREAALAASISCDADTVAYALKCIAGVPEVEEPVEEAPQAFLTEVVSTKRADGKYDIKFIAQLVVPEGYKLDAAGLVWSNKGVAYNDEAKLDIANFGKDKAVKVTNISRINTKWQYSVTIKGVPSSAECVPGRAFATMVKGDGTTVQSTIELGYTE